jgi:hypothetical protein
MRLAVWRGDAGFCIWTTEDRSWILLVDFVVLQCACIEVSLHESADDSSCSADNDNNGAAERHL